MRKSVSFIISAIISILLVFLVIGETAVRCAVSFSDEKWIIEIIDEKEISTKVKKSLEKNFNDKYNSTGIPADVYMNSLSDEWVSNTVHGYISNGINYLSGKSDVYMFEPDFTSLNKDIENFFIEYAEANNFEKDSVFEKKVASTQKNAVSTIKNYCDVAKMDKLYSEGILPQARKYVIFVNKPIIEITVIALLVILIAILIILNRKNIELIFYWTGCILIVSSAILLIPTIYLKATRYFDAFVIKQEQIYITFTSLMYKAVDTVFTAAVVYVIAGIVLVVANGIISLKKNK